MNVTNVSENVRQHWTSSNSLSHSWIFFAAAGVIALFWFALYVIDKRQQSTGATSEHSSQSLFDKLCEAHGLSKREQKLLIAAAESTQTEQAALLFVDPSLLDRMSISADDGPDLYGGLAEKLFGQR